MVNEKIIYRLDGGKKLGYGHIHRAIELRKFLIKKFNVKFVITREISGFSYLKKKTKNIIFLNKKKNLDKLIDNQTKAIIYDTVFLSKRELIRIKVKKIKTIVLEDFKKISNNYANLIINAIVSGNKSKFDKIKNGERYIGSKYKVFKTNIKNYKKKLSKKKKMITISLGGGEVYDGETLKVVKSLYPILIKHNLKINLIIGNGVSHKTYLKIKELSLKIKIYRNLNNIFSILSKSLFVICGGGGTAYESAYFNCVTFFIPRVNHQKKNINFFLKNNFGKKLPQLSKKKELNIFFERYLLNKKFILEQQKISKKIISSNGIHKVVKLIKDKINER